MIQHKITTHGKETINARGFLVFFLKLKFSNYCIDSVRGYPRVTLRSLGRLLSTGYYYLVSYVPTLLVLLLFCVGLIVLLYLYKD